MAVLTKSQAIELAKRLYKLAPTQPVRMDFEDLIEELEHADDDNWQEIKELWQETMNNDNDYWGINNFYKFLEEWQEAKTHTIVQEELEQFIHSRD